MEIDPKKLAAIYNTLSQHSHCDGPECEHCKAMQFFYSIPEIREVIMLNLDWSYKNAIVTNVQFFALFYLGFVLAWQYRDVQELETCIKQE